MSDCETRSNSRHSFGTKRINVEGSLRPTATVAPKSLRRWIPISAEHATAMLEAAEPLSRSLIWGLVIKHGSVLSLRSRPPVCSWS